MQKWEGGGAKDGGGQRKGGREVVGGGRAGPEGGYGGGRKSRGQGMNAKSGLGELVQMGLWCSQADRQEELGKQC